ncbi:MAG TPA: hypothetical protein PKY30_11930, partial [Myxococcota bacterium]|nr:hypothetical protein [Myxococcota bacterium]
MSELRGTIGIAAAFFFLLCVHLGLRVLTPQELGGPVVRVDQAWYDLGDLGALALRSGQARVEARSEPGIGQIGRKHLQLRLQPIGRREALEDEGRVQHAHVGAPAAIGEDAADGV